MTPREWFLDLLPIRLLPGLEVVRWIEVRETRGGRLFTVEAVRVVRSWFGGCRPAG